MKEITILIRDGIKLKGNLTVPPDARSFVIFSHGSGSSRYSRRNNYVADLLNKQHIATLLTDLLTEKEDTIENRFNINLLTERLVEITNHMGELGELAELKTGYFGASTGAASALNAAAILGKKISAVVSRGGRPDLAADVMQNVKAPTLLIVGSLDEEVMGLNQQTFALLKCRKAIEIVQGATHLFEEKGKIDEVAKLAKNWFDKYLHDNSKEMVNVKKRIK